MFFSRRGNRVPLVRGKSGSEQFLRFVGLIAVIAVTAWLFWLNAEKTAEDFETRSTVVDMGDVLSPEMREQVRDFSTLFKEEFGMEVKVWVSDKEFELPELDSKTIFFGVHPEERRVQVVMPPLVANALGARYVDNIGRAYFMPAFERGEWPEGLLTALGDIFRRLSTLNAPESEEFRSKITPPSEAPAQQPPSQ